VTVIEVAIGSGGARDVPGGGRGVPRGGGVGDSRNGCRGAAGAARAVAAGGAGLGGAQPPGAAGDRAAAAGGRRAAVRRVAGTGEVAGRYRAAAAEAALRGEGLRARRKPAIGRLNRWSAVCREAIDGGLGVVGGGQTVAAGGFGPGVSHELGDQDEVVAVADEPGAEGVAQYGCLAPGLPCLVAAGAGPDGNGRGRWSRPASIRSLIVTRPIVPAAFRKLDAIAVLTGPLLPAPRLQRAEDVGEPEPDEADVPLLQRAQHEFFLPIHRYHPRRPCSARLRRRGFSRPARLGRAARRRSASGPWQPGWSSRTGLAPR